MLNRLVEEAITGRAGLTDVYAEHRQRPLSEHADDFESYLSAKDKTAKHVTQTARRVGAILGGCEFKLIADLSGLLLAQWLAAERVADRLGPKTSNYYLRDFKSFVRWLMDQRRMPTDINHPCLKVEPVNAALDVRRARRDLHPAELLALLDAAQANTTIIHKLDGRERYHLYVTACGTGFRVAELASLTPESFSLDSRTPTATVQARRAKNRKATTQPLPPGLVTILRPYLASKTPGEPLWPSCWRAKAAELLQRDLEAAGVPYAATGPDGVKRYADFHSLRHTYVTYLAEAGVSPKHAQELARHSDMRLTMGVYSHVQLEALADSVGRLALPSADKTPDNPLAALPRGDLERLVAFLLGLWGAVLAPSPDLFAPLFAPRSAPDRDGSGQAGTRTRKRERIGGCRKGLKNRRLELVGTVPDGLG
jgi:integrase